MADEAVEQQSEVVAVESATPKRGVGRPRISYEDLPDNAMSLKEQIQSVSKRLRRSSIAHVEYMQLMRLLGQLQDKLKLRQPRPRSRSENGIDFRDIRREEAKRRREALVKESDNGTEQ